MAPEFNGLVLDCFECPPVIRDGRMFAYFAEVELDDGRVFAPRLERRLAPGSRVRLAIDHESRYVGPSIP